ncbi:MAG: PKD domain-containing protein, partial [Flavobacteriales bacterium]|nr:PKD domain-containing protein [Flavobacteriales bacterium]
MMKFYRYCLLITATVTANCAIAQIPVALFQGFNTSGCAPLTVNFIDSSFNAPTSWVWDFGDGTISTSQHPVHVFTIAGAFTVSLTATNGNGSDTFIAPNFVNASATITVDAGADQFSCGINPICLSGTVTGGSSTGQWSTLGTGAFTPNDSDLSACYVPSAIDTASAFVTLVLTSTNNGLCAAVTDTMNISIFPSSTLTLTTDSIDASCGGVCDGAAIAIAAGGTGQYTFIWSNGATTDSITNLCAGTYITTVSDASGCSLSSTVTVASPPTLTNGAFAFGPSCAGLCDGNAMAMTSGGTPPYTYIWDDPSLSTDSMVFGLCPATYTVLVTDANGCTDSSGVVLTNPTAISAILSSTNSSCGSCNGTATASNIIGGNPPYTYLWDDPGAQMTTVATALCPGIYTFLVTDNSGCQDTTSVLITGSSSVVFNMNLVNTTCSACDGSATPTPTNGIPPYTYLWSDSTTGPTMDSVCTGTYNLQITDSAGCIADTTFTIANLGTLAGVLDSSTDVSCNGLSDGSASVSASGGTPPYTYLWNDLASQTNAMAIALATGAYINTITDSAGCTVAVTANINQPPALTLLVTSTDEGCNGLNNGSASSVVSGGTTPYAFQWSNGDSIQNLVSIGSGTYVLTITDLNGCTMIDSAIVMLDSSGLSMNVLSYDPYSCGGYGYATWTTSGGTLPYTYQWTPLPNYQSIWSNYANMPSGTYQLTVQGSTGCADTATVVINSQCAPNTIRGNVYDDFDSNCIKDLGEFGVQNWKVRADPGPVFANTMSDGSYSMYLDSGSYTLSLVMQNPGVRTLVCPSGPGTYSLSLTSTPSVTNNIDFSLLPSYNCPIMAVSFYHVGFTPCFCSWFRVRYENMGTQVAANVYVEVEFPTDVLPVMNCTNGMWGPAYATQWDAQNGNVYTFNLGNVDPGEDDFFYILTETSCNAVLGATKCVTAQIYPYDPCLPVDTVWDKSSTNVNGTCVGDSACFTISNTGDAGTGDMQDSAEYRIYENNMLVFTGAYQLNGQASIVVCWPANSNTVRLEADQRPGHPGNSHPQASVELCGTPSFITGQIVQVPTDDLDDFIDIVCLPVTSSWDPNDKAVAPEGLTSSHFIDSTDVLEYRIRFQNTGTDTAFNVVLVDTISTALDISSIQMGTGSHPFRMELHQNRILQFV